MSRTTWRREPAPSRSSSIASSNLPGIPRGRACSPSIRLPMVQFVWGLALYTAGLPSSPLAELRKLSTPRM
ncbi:hypothetical protein ATCV1_z826R [Acanthocystis turfacea chlorella virus 1]|uniref:Uncharacterized protein z826R n=1 Tax=Chlorovirus heliozoae TaxID=322019 RepID=A7KA86_9PHYC|nr:hypothetical protein ATCV1_z826R [Acanthocystis turfacea chlorella virus 1]ABT16960.1 hypothetical protein ATCV1_z826R [Acanthocystis turfacea chlorella virus 1]